ncbi:MAG: LacI family DNA-binding transcriptional regulator [Lachnospiraceae bacterium]
MKATIKMVAEYAGVSRGTVDRVLNQRGSVSPAAEQKILDAIEKLDYRLNTSARALALSKNTKKLGVLLPKTPGFFLDEVTRGIHKIADESQDMGIEILLTECEPNNPHEYIHEIDKMLAEGVCGFALRAQNTTLIINKINEIADMGIPVITVNSDIPESRRICYVGQNAYQSGRVAAQIIGKQLRGGEHIIVMSGFPEFDSHTNRVKGFLSYLTEIGIKEDQCRVIYSYENYEAAYGQLSESLLEDGRLSCVYMATTPNIAVGDVLKTLHKKDSVFVVSHDTQVSTMEMLRNGYIDYTIVQDMFLQGYEPLRLLRDYAILDKPITASSHSQDIHILSSECIE